MTGSSGNGRLNVLFAPRGTFIRFNNRITIVGLQGPEKVMNWFLDREKREYDVWSQDQVGDADTGENELLNRRRPTRRPAKAPVR